MVSVEFFYYGFAVGYLTFYKHQGVTEHYEAWWSYFMVFTHHFVTALYMIAGWSVVLDYWVVATHHTVQILYITIPIAYFLGGVKVVAGIVQCIS